MSRIRLTRYREAWSWASCRLMRCRSSAIARFERITLSARISVNSRYAVRSPPFSLASKSSTADDSASSSMFFSPGAATHIILIALPRWKPARSTRKRLGRFPSWTASTAKAASKSALSARLRARLCCLDRLSRMEVTSPIAASTALLDASKCRTHTDPSVTENTTKVAPHAPTTQDGIALMNRTPGTSGPNQSISLCDQRTPSHRGTHGAEIRIDPVTGLLVLAQTRVVVAAPAHPAGPDGEWMPADWGHGSEADQDGPGTA